MAEILVPNIKYAEDKGRIISLLDSSSDSIEITDSWKDISKVINTKNAYGILLWVNYDRGDSVAMQIKAQAYLENPEDPNSSVTSGYEFIIESVSATKADLDTEVIEAPDEDFVFVREFIFKESIPYVKFSVKDSADGTGQIDAAHITFTRRRV